ncbi:MAG TPA: TIM-barrel domain-containing protein, partial [bacterium]
MSAKTELNNPAANPEAIVISGNARFTILTAQLIRMEWAEDGQFEDRASFVFINRNLPVPSFKSCSQQQWLIIETENLILKYKINSGEFSRENLLIKFNLNGKKKTWRPGDKDDGNLSGTIRTLDEVKGATSLEPGILSHNGWAVIDDSQRQLFDNCEWQWCIPRADGNRQDWYFFGYGHDYKKALQDFTRVAGKIPLPPRFAFGAWWSRYWAYTDQELKQLVHGFEIHGVPLDVLVIDMDWHETFGLRWHQKRLDQAGQRLGWSGYTWNKILFPDPGGFLSWCKKKGLKTTLNLHPASGIQPHEEKYPDMAQAMGIDPATKKYVPFDIVDKKFAENYLKILHHPLEQQGVDFWWLDWQQQHTTNLPGVNPTWWLNYVHFTDMERRGKRPLIFHRWGGLGNHRYQIGFSGDAISVWESLAFQPYFTATASNVCYGYWSHDIGGHIPGEVSPELYTRWIQFGIFSPILRTHTTRNPNAERRIWAYPIDYFLIMRDAFLLRYELLPYIYTAARQAFDAGISICRPMYYDYPESEKAYNFKNQFMFGDDFLVAPIAEPISDETMLAISKIWLPEGIWVEWFTGTRLHGPGVFQREFALDEIPVYVKAGAIIPMQPKMKNSNSNPIDPLILMIFPGDSGATRIYDDQGNSLGYKKDEFSWTSVHFSKPDDGTLKVEIEPAQGKFPGMLRQRSYEIRSPGTFPTEAVTCNNHGLDFNTEENAPGWRYDGDKLMIIITLPIFQVDSMVEIIIKFSDSQFSHFELLNGFIGKLARLRRIMPLLNSLWHRE